MTVSYAHLLLVDADEQRRHTLAEPLQQRQWYTISMAADTTTALNIIEEGNIDMLLVEVSLAATDDHLFLRTIRANDPENRLKILLIAPAGSETQVKAALEAGANDWLFYPIDPGLLKARCDLAVQQIYLQQQLLSTVNSFQEMMHLVENLRETILPLSVSLAGETEFSRLMERILWEAKEICRADAGAIFLLTPEQQLRLVLARYDSLQMDWSLSNATDHPYATIPLVDTESGDSNRQDVVACAALTGQSINIPHRDKEDSFDFALIDAFDQAYDYQTSSLLTVPLRNEQVQGVLLLINAHDSETGRVTPFTRYHVLVADSLASQAGVLIHNHVLRERSVKLNLLQEELRIGREIQMGFFPAELPQPAGWEVAALMRPAREVSGDFYDAFQLPNGHFAFVMADVCGKGVGAALFMSLIRTLLRAFIQRYYQNHEHRCDPAQALARTVTFTNDYILANHTREHMFATLFTGLLDTTTATIYYVNAGHEPPLLWHPGQSDLQRLTRSGPAVGLRKDAVYQVQRVDVAPGSRLLVFTDGVVEARDPAGKPFSYHRLEQILVSPPPTVEILIHQIDAQVSAFTQKKEPWDDVTLLAIHRQVISSETGST